MRTSNYYWVQFENWVKFGMETGQGKPDPTLAALWGVRFDAEELLAVCVG
jgi:hypothetical protein